MATKLKNLRMTSVDLVRNGANQAADICLYKSADPTEDPTMPTAEETNVLKRFFARLFATATEAAVEPDDPIEKADEESCLADVYKSAITESLQSIAADETLSATEKNDMIAKSLSEYHDAMLDLFGFGPEEEPLQKSDDDDDLDDWEWDEEEEEDVGKANPNHDSLGRFASSPGGGSAGAGATHKLSDMTVAQAKKAVHDEVWSAPTGATVKIAVGTKGEDYTKVGEGKWKYRSGQHSGYYGTNEVTRNLSAYAVANMEKGVLSTIKKTADFEEYEDVEKFNENHDALGRFAPAGGGGGGGGLKGSDVRNFGVPGYSSSHHMNKKERKLAQTIIDNEELDLEIRDESDAYGNASTSLHGTREDYQTFKDMWQMVAPSTLGKSADIDEIEEV